MMLKISFFNFSGNAFYTNSLLIDIALSLGSAITVSSFGFVEIMRALLVISLPIMDQAPLILFDGVCNFCNYWVNFAIKRDRKKKLKFTTLQGETAKQLLPQYNINPTSINSVIFIDKGKAYTQSSASLRICKYLHGGWKLFYGLMIIPKFIRDLFYNIIARKRYKWFGKKESCMMPSPELKERFLD